MMQSKLDIYISEEKTKTLRISFQYYGGGWIFFKTATLINSNGDKIAFTFKPFDKKNHVESSGNVSESIDQILSIKDGMNIYELIKKNKNGVKLRLSGEYYKDYEIDELEISGLESILKYYFENQTK